MTSASVVRTATREDEGGLMDMCRLLHSENGIFPLDEELVRDMLHRAFNRGGGLIGVIGEKDKLEGMIYLHISNYWYSREVYLEELFNFVHPDHRRSHHAKALIDFAKKCAGGDTGVRLLIGVVSNIQTQAKVRLYERQLGPPAGAFFLYPSEKRMTN